MKTQTATFSEAAKTKYMSNHRKEDKLHREYSAIVPDKEYPGASRAVVTLRIYWPATVAYACLWVNGDKMTTQGSDKAGGGGYCKESASAGGSIRNAGIVLDSSIEGRGTDAVRDAVLAIACAAGHENAVLHVAHG